MEFHSEEKSIPSFLDEEEKRRFVEKRWTHILSPSVQQRGDVFLTYSGICFQLGKIFADSVYHKAYPKLRYFLQAHYNLLVKSKKKIVGTSLYLHSPWSVVNYHHWLVDSLPRLYPFVSRLKEVILLPEELRTVDFVQQSLKILGVRHIGYFSKGEVVYAEKLQYAELTPGDFMLTGNLKPAVGLLKSALKESAAPPYRKIYLSRQGTGYRTIANQQETEEILFDLGFEKLEPDKLSLEEQIAVFSETKILLGVHGAGLTNSVFMPEGAVLYELHPSIRPPQSIFNYCYWNLASYFGLGYYFQGCEPVETKERFHTANLVVDTVKLRNQLSQVLRTI